MKTRMLNGWNYEVKSPSEYRLDLEGLHIKIWFCREKRDWVITEISQEDSGRWTCAIYPGFTSLKEAADSVEITPT